MPGDAFFHSELTESSLVEASDAGIRLKYSHVPVSGGLGGYAGFEFLVVTGDTTALRQHLRILYDSLRVDYPKEVRVNRDGSTTELNGFHVFVYNADVKWSVGFSSQRLGVKYNESWLDLPSSAFESETRQLGFGPTKAHSYTTFVNMSDAVVHDWKYGKEIEGLAVGVPEGVGWGITGPPIAASVSIVAARVQIVVIPESNLKPYFLLRRGHPFYTVTNRGVRLNCFKGEDVVSEEWHPEVRPASKDDD